MLGLQDAYYQHRLQELRHELGQVEARLAHTDLSGLIEAHAQASQMLLRHALRQRYGSRQRHIYPDQAWKSNESFIQDYPVILSTCHSLAQCVPDGRLVDLLILDESSQISLLVAAVALARARQVVVVGDTRQLPHIPGEVADEIEPPHPAFDHRKHNLLSSLHALHGEDLPSTMLVEHYRCAPAIIEFCNRAFYDNQLICFSTGHGNDVGMEVWTTPDGSHMRQPRGGGATNEREIDIIRQKVIPELGLVGRQVGYISPYRAQANKLDHVVNGPDDPEDILDVSVGGPTGDAQSDTVHRFQGRERDVVVLSTVIDDSWRGRYARRFVDEPRLINVAVSRAVNHFVLVTHHRRHPGSRHLADLIGYIEYQDPTAVRESGVVSIFDLLYRDYAPVLDDFARRVTSETEHRSEDIAYRALTDALQAEDEAERFGGLIIRKQYRLANLFTDMDLFDADQQRFIRTTASVDFVVERTVSRKPILAVEVDGWAFHENRPDQLKRDAIKDSIFSAAGLPLLRLATTGSGEPERIITALRQALDLHAGVIDLSDG